ADERAGLMSRLMAEDPAQALAHSLSFAQYAALPPEVQKRVERPFSIKGDFNVFPVCSAGMAGRSASACEVQADGSAESWHSYAPQRESIGTKKGIPLQGFELRGQAVIRNEVMQVLDTRDADAARRAFGMAVANSDPGRDFLTGEHIMAEPVTAAAGGRLYLFARRAN